MSEYQIRLKPIYSCPAEKVPEGISLPKSWSSLSGHQVETLAAIRNPEIDVIFNTAMTGDGKSLAAYLEVLQGNGYAIGLYPTNELARDQELQIRGYIDTFKPTNDPRVVRLSGAELEQYAENEGLRKSAAIASRSGQAEVLLTNPDIFHYLHRGAYLFKGDSPDRLWNQIDKNFDLFIFDEFHVFNPPQVASIINTLLLIRCTNRRKKFLFLSATPEPPLIERLQTAGFRVKLINNTYHFPDTVAECQQLEQQHWRQVSRSITLNFIPLDPSFNASQAWIVNHLALILTQFQQHPGSKGAIILNSIAAVKRLVPFLREQLQPVGLTVGENTGLSGSREKARSLGADLVVGTSTIDVGVDFKINFLIFESADAGNFIQRLGRLGRHDGYEENGKFVKFKAFTAYALVPNFLVERLFTGEVPPLSPTGDYDRSFLHQTIVENYRQINDFRGYYSRWGAVQSCFLAYQLRDRTIQSQYAQSREKFCQLSEAVFNTQLKRVAGRIRGWAQGWQQLSGKKGNPIAEDAASFRGVSVLQCGLYDITEANPVDRFKTYDLPGILGNLEIEWWTKAGFIRTLQQTATDTRQPIAKGRFEYCLGFMKLHAYREERLNWKFTYPGDLQPIAEAFKVQVITGIQVWQPDNLWVGAINQRLQKQGLVSYVLRYSVVEVRRRLRLPMHFQIYGISDQYSVHEATAPYAIAIGQSALLLDTLAYQFQTQGGEIWIA
ncbi:MAG: type I-D CRISPR-associated helicase Cas3' [Coleofasciculus sp. G3-WIS-01]|uniref:type I-D CRISPR-associated helicase Cas3' n=1 Tax=Coleofasciculus sp. G3-WIS-01 TaxID=3069528 RepID=UPI00330255C5